MIGFRICHSPLIRCSIYLYYIPANLRRGIADLLTRSHLNSLGSERSLLMEVCLSCFPFSRPKRECIGSTNKRKDSNGKSLPIPSERWNSFLSHMNVEVRDVWKMKTGCEENGKERCGRERVELHPHFVQYIKPPFSLRYRSKSLNRWKKSGRYIGGTPITDPPHIAHDPPRWCLFISDIQGRTMM
jgi:hypothetical protein